MSPEKTLSTTTSDAPVAADIECPACGTDNSSDSKFCRQCGHLLRALGTNGSDAKKAAPASVKSEDSTLTSPAEIDARRSHQLLDRALLLSERGDLNAALLACRQAVALDSNHSEPYVLLGTLLERSGDLRGAMNAYERVLQISPDNVLERDSLARLKTRVDRAPAFNFNADDLFASGDTLPPFASEDTLPSVAAPEIVVAEPVVAPVERDEHGIEARLPPTSAALRAVAPVKTAPAVAEVPLVFEFDATPIGATPSVSPLTGAINGGMASPTSAVAPAPKSSPSATPAVAPSVGVPKIERRTRQRRQVNVPVATERRVGSERRVPTTRAGATFSPSVWPAPNARPATSIPTPVPTRTPAAVAPLDFSFGQTAPVKAPLWAQMMRGSSFFARTLPLVAVGVVGLGFLSWARSQAVELDANNRTGSATRIVSPDGTTTIIVQPSVTQPGTDLVPGGPTTSAVNPGNNGGFPITNATAVPATPAAATSSGSTTPPAPARPASNTPRRNSAGGSTPVRANGGSGSPNFPLAPAPVPPASAPSNGSGNGNAGGIILPPPQTQTGGSVSPPIQVGGTPLNPAGSPQEGRIRITQGSIVGRPAPPPRSGTQARGDERTATSAAATGNSDRAINSLTSALNATGADQGFLLQQRAMAFLDRGDSARAVEDFQAAISAYQDQLNRGENVAAAQAGIRAARAGMGMAQSRR